MAGTQMQATSVISAVCTRLSHYDRTMGKSALSWSDRWSHTSSSRTLRTAIDLCVSKADSRGRTQTRCLSFRGLQIGGSHFIPCMLLHISKTEKEPNTSLKIGAGIVGM